jgi:hypothetical protein
MKALGAFAGLLMMLLFPVWMGYRIYAGIVFDRNCGGYIAQAGNANTIDMAKDSLKKAVDYATKEELTSGYTSIIYTEPDEDVGFWYKNIANSLVELENVQLNASDLEKSNILIKLREALSNHGKGNSESVRVPAGIAIFPHNTFWMWFGVGGLILGIIGFFLFLWGVSRD